jgi:peptide/nickel transport system ATP-binding protein
MRNGEIVERGTVRAVLKTPQHTYTRALLDALPSRRAGAARGGASASGQGPVVAAGRDPSASGPLQSGVKLDP